MRCYSFELHADGADTAHAVGCAAANKALELIKRLDDGGRWDAPRQDWAVADASEARPFSVWDRDFVLRLSALDRVEGVMALGTVLAIHLRAEDGAGYSSTASIDVLAKLRAATPSIHARPLGNVVYFMSSFNSELGDVQRAIEAAMQ